MRRSYFHNPIFYTSTPLTLLWDEPQVRPIIDQLSPYLPGRLTEKMRLAVGGVVRSIVRAQRETGYGVHFARGRDHYSKLPKRYRCGGDQLTWYYVNYSMQLLEAAGFVEISPGKWSGAGRSFQSAAWATDHLLSLVASLIDPREEPAVIERVEVIVLRDREDKRPLDYPDTDETRCMREGVERLNTEIGKLTIRSGDAIISIPPLARIFNGTFERGGRFYCQGPSYQMMPAHERCELQIQHGGEWHPVVEVDYRALHATMAYAETGETPPDGDLYGIDGFARDLVKTALMVMFNAQTMNGAILAITELLRADPQLRAQAGVASRNRRECRPVAKSVIEAIENKHAPIRQLFGSDCGARFLRRDSEMAWRVMGTMVGRTGRCPLPMHDSFVVSAVDEDALCQVMTDVAEEFGLSLHMKVMRAGGSAVTMSP